MNREDELFQAAHALQMFLWKNVGKSADWPVSLFARDEAAGVELRDLLQAHHDAIKKYLIV